MDLTGMIIDYTRERIADPIDKKFFAGLPFLWKDNIFS